MNMESNKIKDKQSFAEKHTKWNQAINMVVAFSLVALAILVVVTVIRYVMKAVASLLTWASQTLPKMDTVVIVALITGAVSILGVVLSSIVAKAVEYRRIRREYLTQKREEPYSEFIEMIYKMQQSNKLGKEYSKEEKIKDLMRFSKKITLWGSPKVVNDWVKFREKALDGNSNGMDNLFLTETIMNDMRKDLGIPKVKKGHLLAFFVNDIKAAMKNK